MWGGIVVAAAGLMGLLHRIGWIDLSDKSRRGGTGSTSSSGLMGIGDEVFAPTRHEARIEMDRQTVLPAPAPAPGDGDRGVIDLDTRVTIDVSDHRRR